MIILRVRMSMILSLVFLLKSIIKTDCVYMLESPLLYGHPISFIKKRNRTKQAPKLQQSIFYAFCSRTSLKFYILPCVHLQSLALKVSIDNLKSFWKVLDAIQGQTRCPSVVSCYLTLAGSQCLSVQEQCIILSLLYLSKNQWFTLHWTRWYLRMHLTAAFSTLHV